MSSGDRLAKRSSMLQSASPMPRRARPHGRLEIAGRGRRDSSRTTVVLPGRRAVEIQAKPRSGRRPFVSSATPEMPGKAPGAASSRTGAQRRHGTPSRSAASRRPRSASAPVATGRRAIRPRRPVGAPAADRWPAPAATPVAVRSGREPRAAAVGGRRVPGAAPPRSPPGDRPAATSRDRRSRPRRASAPVGRGGTMSASVRSRIASTSSRNWSLVDRVPSARSATSGSSRTTRSYVPAQARTSGPTENRSTPEQARR